jgi:hypothetical protein
MREIAFDKYELKSAYHWTEYFGSAVLGRVTRLAANVLSRIGNDLIARPSGCRTFSTQTFVAVKPGAPA